MNAFNKVKKFTSEAYSKSKNVLNNVDNGIKISKHIYSSISPLFDNDLGNHIKAIHGNVMHGISKCDDIKKSGLENHDNLQNEYNKVKHQLFKNV
jgi:hypothetical protein